MPAFRVHAPSRACLGRGSRPWDARCRGPGAQRDSEHLFTPLSCRKSGLQPRASCPDPGQCQRLRSRRKASCAAPVVSPGGTLTASRPDPFIERVGPGQEARPGAGSRREVWLRDPKPQGCRKGAGPQASRRGGFMAKGRGKREAPGEQRDQHKRYILETLGLRIHAGSTSPRAARAGHGPDFGASCGAGCAAERLPPPPPARALGLELTSVLCPRNPQAGEARAGLSRVDALCGLHRALSSLGLFPCYGLGGHLQTCTCTEAFGGS